MGLYNDNVSQNRTEWKYPYTGMELISPSARLYQIYFDKEKAAREKLAEYMKDMTISNSDRRIDELKRDIVSYGTLKEQCQVFKHEFARNHETVYELGLGDVTFFGLAE